MPLGIENGKEDETCCTSDGSDDADDGAALLEPRCVGVQASLVSQPALEDEDEVKGYDRNRAHGNEHGFQFFGSNVGDVSVSIRRSSSHIRKEETYAMCWFADIDT